MSEVTDILSSSTTTVLNTLGDRHFYIQIAASVVAVLLAWAVSRFVEGRLSAIKDAEGSHFLSSVKSLARSLRQLAFPFLAAVFLGIAVATSAKVFGEKWMVQAIQGLAFLRIIHVIAFEKIESKFIRDALFFVFTPIALLYLFGLLGDTIAILDSVTFKMGDISVSLYAVLRTIIFGAVLFWVGRISNSTGRRLIRGRSDLDDTAKEITLKAFQIALFVVIGVLLLQVIGIDLTALVVFGGAIGVGLGFGLQQIASNFISGIIILLDRSIALGDFIELEDGRSGRLRELSMRSATLETYDGKDIMVPNERFITTAFTNWTHNNQKQRYPLHFSVAYGTDLEKMFPLIRDVVASHPKVLSGEDVPIEERPDAEIESFGDSGINILVEFWMEGIDDGEHRVGGDLLMMIWTTLRANGIEIPFPQREVRMLKET